MERRVRLSELRDDANLLQEEIVDEITIFYVYVELEKNHVGTQVKI